MMLFKFVLEFSLHNVFVFMEIILLLSKLQCSGPTLTVPLLYHHPPLKLHPFLRFHPTLIQTHQLFRNNNQDQHYFGIHNTHDSQITEILDKDNLNVGQQTTATIYSYLPTTITPFTESAYNIFSENPIHGTNFLHKKVHGFHSSPLNNLFNNLILKSSTHEPDKDITGNNINKVTSHLSNTKQNIYETSKLRLFENTVFTNNGLERAADNFLIDNTSTNENIVTPSARKRRISLFNEFMNGLGKFERKFYVVTFKKLTDMAASGPRAENSISFVQSALFLQLLLLVLSIDRNVDSKAKIDSCIGIENNISDTERIQIIKDVVSMLPKSSHGLVFRRSSRLVLGAGYNVSETFQKGAAALLLRMDQFNGTETPEMLSAVLNQMVEEDSRGAIHNTFDPDDLSGKVTAVFLTTLYLRSSWRTNPTLLNGTRLFRDSYADPHRTIRMIRLNDKMRYANLTECDAEALEVFYLKPGLSLLILVPHGSSLRRLASYVAGMGLNPITSQMTMLRVAADLPLYTLRMSLLLPNKLDGLGLADLLHADGHATDNELKMSHGLQRLMFWAEAGRNAYKDDGLEWDDTPHMKMVIDRPYMFFVRWNNMTLMNGHFVL